MVKMTFLPLNIFKRFKCSYNPKKGWETLLYSFFTFSIFLSFFLRFLSFFFDFSFGAKYAIERACSVISV